MSQKPAYSSHECLKYIRCHTKQHYILSFVNFLYEEQFYFLREMFELHVGVFIWHKWTTIKHTWQFSIQAPKYQISRSAKQRWSMTEVLPGRCTASHRAITLLTLCKEHRLCCFLKCVMKPPNATLCIIKLAWTEHRSPRWEAGICYSEPQDDPVPLVLGELYASTIPWKKSDKLWYLLSLFQHTLQD